MFIKVTFDRFKQEFCSSQRANQFPECLEVLFNYFNDNEIEVELDVIALCCEYTEFKDMKEALESYPSNEVLKPNGKSLDFDKTLENFLNHTLVIGEPKNAKSPFIISNY